jgi:hypothetical protein
VLHVPIHELEPKSSHLHGATIGEAHAEQISKLARGHSECAVVIIDFKGVVTASASYFKRVISPFFQTPNNSGLFARETFPIGINITSIDLREELTDFLVGKGWVLIEAQLEGSQLSNPQIIGELEGASEETYRELQAMGKATAAELHEKFPQKSVNQTAWNNRLAQLLDLRVAQRERSGRFWIYQPTVKGQ